MRKRSYYAEQMRLKQEASLAHRLWILQIAYEKTLTGETTEVAEITERHNLTTNEVVSAFKILQKQMLMNYQHYSTDGIPHG